MSYLTGNYQISLVLLSVFVAMMASYTALSLAGRVTETEGRASSLWLAGGAVVDRFLLLDHVETAIAGGELHGEQGYGLLNLN